MTRNRSPTAVPPPPRLSAVPPPPFSRGRILKPAYRADDFPFRVGYRLHRKPRQFDQRHSGEPLVGLDRRQRHRPWQRLDDAKIDHAERPGLVGRVGIVGLAHLDDADDLLAFAGMIEEGLLAELHRHQVELGRVVAHAVPARSLLAGLHLLLEGPGGGFALDQPMSHLSSLLSERRANASPSYGMGAVA